ncbi:MAG: 1-deoxy-D-xylulose-5-phosphate reductoisomerase [Ruminococcaceae bacterium]|nr:1-deoxy-D-xylulose-5-phosphate reductoisomerase [Oscillospiraceae bacterium]
MSKTIAILGATGSVGIQAQEVALARGYKVDLISANRDYRAAEEAARRLLPATVVMADADAAGELRTRLADTDIKVLSGADAICESIAESSAEVVVNSILGEAGLSPTIATINSGKRLALANKESLVIAGEIVMNLAKEKGTEIIPVDSEHSAIFQSLKSGRKDEIRRIILTASGGPFFGRTSEEIKSVTLADTLAHPTWKMGKKITVDSATLMNKGFEIIEAAHLFSVSAEQIEVVVHRESILHSAVEYIDNTIVGEMSLPDMRSCVQYAVDYPERFAGVCKPLDFASLGKMTFAKPDEEAFPLLSMAKRSLSDGGAMSAVLNAADEIAVDAFLKEKISFCDIFDSVISTYERMSAAKSAHTLEEIISADREARKIAQEYAK